MNLSQKLDKALGLNEDQSTKGPGQASTGPELGATKDNISKSKKGRKTKNKADYSDE